MVNNYNIFYISRYPIYSYNYKLHNLCKCSNKKVKKQIYSNFISN